MRRKLNHHLHLSRWTGLMATLALIAELTLKG